MEIAAIFEILRDYDIVTVIVGLILYVFMNKKIDIVDRAVNQRPKGSKTISDEVTEINHKLDLSRIDLRHVKKEVDAHRLVDEVAFNDIRADIRILANKK
jgi:hypothetical protein